jgi:hypothetical protein
MGKREDREEIARRWVDPGVAILFEAEIRNEGQGGVRPATLSSTIDSVAQMPDDILGEFTGGKPMSTLVALLVIRDLLPGRTPVANLLPLEFS